MVLLISVANVDLFLQLILKFRKMRVNKIEKLRGGVVVINMQKTTIFEPVILTGFNLFSV